MFYASGTFVLHGSTLLPETIQISSFERGRLHTLVAPSVLHSFILIPNALHVF
jgi:hypothetical protein